MRKICIFPLPIFITILLISCNYISNNPFYIGNDVNTRNTNKIKEIDFELKDKSELPDTYTALFITDLHFGYSNDTIPTTDFFNWLNDLKDINELPKFMICGGDISDYGQQAQQDEYKEFCRRLENEFNLKIFNIAGNHDYYKSGWEVWKENCYPHTSFYHFTTNNFSWYFLDTGTGTLGLQQYNALKESMENETKPKIVITHYPLTITDFVSTLQNTTERNLLLHLFSTTNVKAYISGHQHYNECVDFKSFQEYCISAFRKSKGWALIDINEKEETVSVRTWCKTPKFGKATNGEILKDND